MRHISSHFWLVYLTVPEIPLAFIRDILPAGGQIVSRNILERTKIEDLRRKVIKVCVCVYIYIYIYIYTLTQTYTLLLPFAVGL